MKLNENEINYIAISAMNGESFLQLALNQIGTDTTKDRVYSPIEVLTAYTLATNAIVFDSLPEFIEI